MHCPDLDYLDAVREMSVGDRPDLLERSANLAVTACSDTTVVHGTTYQYMVLWLAADGTTLAHSNHVAVTP